MDKNRDMVMMNGGQMILLVNREMLIMEQDVVTPDGILVRPDGTLLLQDGRTTGRLLENEALYIDPVLSRQVQQQER